jgi:hypothetical protein
LRLHLVEMMGSEPLRQLTVSQGIFMWVRAMRMMFEENRNMACMLHIMSESSFEAVLAKRDILERGQVCKWLIYREKATWRTSRPTWYFLSQTSMVSLLPNQLSTPTTRDASHSTRQWHPLSPHSSDCPDA